MLLLGEFKNLAFGLKQRKIPKAKIDVRVNEVAGMLGISDLLRRKPKELSGGQRLNALVEVVEPIGSEVVLLATCGSSQLTARVDPQTQARPQMQLKLILDMNHMHLFDRDTKEAY